MREGAKGPKAEMGQRAKGQHCIMCQSIMLQLSCTQESHQVESAKVRPFFSGDRKPYFGLPLAAVYPFGNPTCWCSFEDLGRSLCDQPSIISLRMSSKVVRS